MSLGEFDIIARYFTSPRHRADVLLGVGDDAAIVHAPAHLKMVAAVDTINEGVHFPVGSQPNDIGYRALAVNLSDFAAMGAEPRWFTLSLSLPKVEAPWLESFTTGLFELAHLYHLELIGGDTTRGPLSISLQLLGCVEEDGWLQRSGGQPGDVIYVSGVPGEAAAGLQLLRDQDVRCNTQGAEYLLQRFLRPEPRVALGRTIRRLAHAALDISDGLVADLSKLCQASRCGAQIDLAALPHSVAMQALFNAERCQQWALNGGDDYELLFTLAPQQCAAFAAMNAGGVQCTPIGHLQAGEGVQCFYEGQPVAVPALGFDHFRS